MATKKYLRKVIGDESVFEQAEKEYIIARRKKAFDEYWQEQVGNLPKQITSLFKELVSKRRNLGELESKVSAYRNITDLQFLLYFLQDILFSEQEGIKINPYDDPFLNQSLNKYAYGSEDEDSFFEDSDVKDWFFEDDGTEDNQWGEAPSITLEGFQRLIDINTSNVFENNLYISRRWNKLREEIKELFDGYEKYQEFSKRKKTTTSFEEHLKEVLSKRSKKDAFRQSDIQNKLLSFIDEFEIVFDDLANDNLMEKFMGEELAIEIRNQYENSNRIVNLKSEIFKLIIEIDELTNTKIPIKITAHIIFLEEYYFSNLGREKENAKDLITKEVKLLLEGLREIEHKSKARSSLDAPRRGPVHDLLVSMENTYIEFLGDGTPIEFWSRGLGDNEYSPDQFTINVAERLAYDLQSRDEAAKTEDKDTETAIELYVQGKGNLYPIQSLPQDQPIGLTHSGGGRRAEVYNLGIQQELARLGALPWFDYLSTVSGGGWTGFNMISLLSGKPNKGDYFFNTQWEKYPYNPGIKIFKLPQDPKKIKDPDTKTRWIEEAVSYEDGQNAQLKYLRDKGNYLAPRQGWINRDALRVSGWVVSSLLMNILMFLIILLMVSSSHYLLNLAFAPEIGNTYYIFENCTPGEEGCSETPLTDDGCPEGEICFQPDEISPAILINCTLGEAGCPETALTDDSCPEGDICFQPDEISPAILINCTLGEAGCPETALTDDGCPEGEICFQPDEVTEAIFDWDDKWSIYVALGSISFLLSLLGISIIKLSYKKFDNKEVEIDSAKWKARYNFWFFVLLFVPLIIIINPQTRKVELTEWIFVLFLMILLFLFWIRRTYWKVPAGDGRSNEEDIDTFLLENLAFFSLSFPIFMIAFTKWMLHASGLLTSDSLQIYWVLMPLVISLGVGLGLWAYLIFHTKKPFGESRFRTIFWAYLGYHNMYLIVIALFTGISVSLFFSQIDTEGTRLIIPVSTAFLSAISTGIMAYTKDKGKMSSLISGFNSIAKFSAGLRNYVLGFLVILLNLSIIYIFESLLDQKVTDHNTVAYIVAGSLLLFVIFSRFVNFNEMSLHYFWRDRTEEAFLKTDMVSTNGKVISVRDDRNLLLGYDINNKHCSAPYHLINTAINLQGSWRFSVKDRKSQHFIFSRHYTGSKITGYIDTSRYRIDYVERAGKKDDWGMTKYSKAMAISAAAFASALGDQSFFAEGFAMTLFNIRLGWWMLNPKLYDSKINITQKFPAAKKSIGKKLIDETKFYAKLENKSKWLTSWAPFIFDEALSLASERRELVNLSDGGHTGDNPGVYPLLQRRCKVILVGDASYDPAAQCEQFMNALLYAKVDMGIHVDIDLTGLYPATEDDDGQKEGMSKNHCAVGKISYPAIRDVSDETKLLYPEETGWIIYLKTTITPDDPSQLQQYWMGHKDMFPQPSTLDQFFEEDQYEAQRLLGEISVNQTLEKLEKYYQTQIKEIKDTNEKGRAVFKLGLVQQVLKRNPDFTELKKNFSEMMGDLQKALMQ